MSLDSRDIYFNTSNNYLKRSNVFTASHSFSTTYSSTSGTFNHGLGYVPAIRMFFEINGVIYESYGQTDMIPPNADTGYVPHTITSTAINYTAGNGAGGAKTIKVRCIVYVDDLA